MKSIKLFLVAIVVVAFFDDAVRPSPPVDVHVFPTSLEAATTASHKTGTRSGPATITLLAAFLLTSPTRGRRHLETVGWCRGRGAIAPWIVLKWAGRTRIGLARVGTLTVVLALLQTGCDATSPSVDPHPSIVVEARPAVSEQGKLQVRLTSSGMAAGADVPVVLRVYDLQGQVINEVKFASMQDISSGAIFTEDSIDKENER